jgi:hypothetical protein
MVSNLKFQNPTFVLTVAVTSNAKSICGIIVGDICIRTGRTMSSSQLTIYTVIGDGEERARVYTSSQISRVKDIILKGGIGF